MEIQNKTASQDLNSNLGEKLKKSIVDLSQRESLHVRKYFLNCNQFLTDYTPLYLPIFEDSYFAIHDNRLKNNCQLAQQPIMINNKLELF